MKEQFIIAYMYSYGATRQEAIKAYNSSSAPYIITVIESYKHDCRKAWAED